MTRPQRASVMRDAPGAEEVSGGAPEAVRIGLLGGFWVSVGERTIEENEWRLRKAQSLSKLLALAPRHRLHREQVMDLLWPELDLEAAANNLHRTLHAARRVLGPTPATASRYYLQLRGEQLALSPDGELWVDVEAFEEAAAAARRSRDPGSYRAAIELYAGDLLPQDLYEEWTEPRREELRRAYLSLLLALAVAHEKREEFGPAIEALRRVVAVEPTHEEANVGLMRLYALSGRRQEALKHYERFLEALEEEGVRPGRAGRRLYGEILEEQFPPPKEQASVTPSPPSVSPGAGLHNLPEALSSFVGRERELVEVKRALSMTRLLTLTGAGGSGKTRLALEVAKSLAGSYQDGVWLVDLAPLAEGALVAQAVAGVLKVRERPDRPLIEALVEALRSKKLLLVLDNCEHLVDAVARLAETLLKSCPGLRILATSRQALNIAGEINHPVPPLALPDPKLPPTMEELEGTESARLFVERALHRAPTFALMPQNAEAVAQICRRLDGIPLAIELAAARVRALSVEQISERLSNSLGLLTGGSRTADPRQQTLEGALDWGYDLLEETEKELFGRLSVFAGGWTLEAAEVVGAGGGIGEGDVLDLVSGLVDKSLVVVESSPVEGALRYRMLEPIRQYAREKLETSGETDAVRRRHASFFLALVEDAEQELKGPEQEAWLERLETQHDNLHAALRWGLDAARTTTHPEEAEMGLRLAGALGAFWTIRGHFAEGRGWLESALAKNDEAASARIYKVLFWAAHMAREQGDYERAEALGEESLELARDLGDKARVAAVLYDLGLLALFRNSYEHSRERLEEALVLQRELGDKASLALTLQALGSIAIARKDYVRAAELHEEALRLARETGDTIAVIFALGAGAFAAVGRGDHEVARRLRTEGLRLAVRLGHERLLVHHLDISAVQAGAEGRLVRAARLWGATEALREAIGAAFLPIETVTYGPYIRAVREGLDEPARETAWAEGRAMTRDEAVEYALSQEELPGGVSRGEAAGGRPDAPLSPREREVARLVAEGFTNRRIAEVLGITRRTADTHVARILRKLGFDSRERVAAWMREHLPEEEDRG